MCGAVFRLAVRFNGKLLDTFEFDKDQVTIGRAPDCDVVIDNLGVSRVHAQVERNGDFFVLRDLNSNNGTFVRGEKIPKYNLNSGDEFFLGKHSISFSSLEKQEDDWLTDSPQPQSRPEEAGEAAGKMPQQLTVAIDARDVALLQGKKGSVLAAYLTVTGASGVRQNVPIGKTVFFFGSHPACDFSLHGWFINKRHVALIREESGFRLVHLGNKKPPKINGLEVDDQKLKSGDILEIDELRMTFNFGNPS